MALRIAINGFGRIGRCVLRAIYERNLQDEFEVVAINELADCETIGYMLRYDSTHGRFSRELSVANDVLTIVEGDGSHHIQVLHKDDFNNQP